MSSNEKYNGVNTMQAQNNGAARRKQVPDVSVINVKRNPYLVDYEEQRRLREAMSDSPRRPMESRNQRGSRPVEATGRQSVVRTAAEWQPRVVPDNRQRNSAAARERRRRQVRRQRMAVGAWALCILIISSILLLKQGNVSAAEPGNSTQKSLPIQDEPLNVPSGIVQGFPAEEFAKHPAWTENFLTPNEYSRPGEALPEVKDIFVHYTANPGTSAAQNRSYFEQQKDMHQASVSAHFIIGYEGEIIQCVPLDEIAYAVQTRNYDSISIECCYKSEDGSFTQATYDSLISLLAWLTDIYDLDTNHILRHYDCGGKKCPIYYTEHEDAWEQLKRDVAAEKEK